MLIPPRTTFHMLNPILDIRFNYIRNSVKVVVDAYNGSVDFYLADDSDPIIRFYASCFPNTFQSIDDMPEGLRAHVRYPSDFFDVQATMYRAYHMNDVNVFYNKEDMWGLPRNCMMAKKDAWSRTISSWELPEEQNAEFILLLPFVPTGKDNMISGWPLDRMVTTMVSWCSINSKAKRSMVLDKLKRVLIKTQRFQNR